MPAYRPAVRGLIPIESKTPIPRIPPRGAGRADHKPARGEGSPQPDNDHRVLAEAPSGIYSLQKRQRGSRTKCLLCDEAKQCHMTLGELCYPYCAQHAVAIAKACDIPVSSEIKEHVRRENKAAMTDRSRKQRLFIRTMKRTKQGRWVPIRKLKPHSVSARSGAQSARRASGTTLATRRLHRRRSCE